MAGLVAAAAGASLEEEARGSSPREAFPQVTAPRARAPEARAIAERRRKWNEKRDGCMTGDSIVLCAVSVSSIGAARAGL
jgi:hypothetical protein